jgi:hypothetical protein
VLDISREAELVALGETLGEVNNIVVTAGSQAPGGLLSGLDLRAARLAFDTKFWGSINVARYLSGNIAPRYADVHQRVRGASHRGGRHC